jgi:hypothetical protein
MSKAIVFYFSLLSIFCSVESYAQKGLNIGINLGYTIDKIPGYVLNNAKLINNSTLNSHFNNGFSYGLTIRYGLSQKTDLSTGIERSYRDLISDTKRGRISAFYDVIHVPMKINYSVWKSKNGTNQIKLALGSVLTFYNSSSSKIAGGNPGSEGYFYITSGLQQHKMLYGVLVGCGLEKSFKEYGNIYLGMSYKFYPSNSLRHYAIYSIENKQSTKEIMFGPSQLSLDFVYFFPWKAFTGKT